MIDCAGIFYAEGAGHEGKIAKGTAIVKPQDLTLRCSRRDGFSCHIVPARVPMMVILLPDVKADCTGILYAEGVGHIYRKIIRKEVNVNSKDLTLRC